MRRLFPALLAAVVVCGAGCGRTKPPAADATLAGAGFAGFTVRVTVIGGTIRVRSDWQPGPTDGNGNPDFWSITSGTNAGAPKTLRDSVVVAFAVRTYTAEWTDNPPGTYSGYACGKSIRRGVPSTTASCKAWTATVADVPPPPPIMDSAGAEVAALLDSTTKEPILLVRRTADGWEAQRHWTVTYGDAQGIDHIYVDAAPASLTRGRNLSFCLAYILPGRKAGIRTGSSGHCAAGFAAFFPAEARTLTAVEQAKVDSAIGQQIWEFPTRFLLVTTAYLLDHQQRDSVGFNPALNEIAVNRKVRQPGERATWLALAGLPPPGRRL